MSYRNFLQIVSEVYRHLQDFRERAEVWEVQQAVNDALLEICQFHNWNFLIDRYDIGLANAYSTGTVSVTNGSTLVLGQGTAWDNVNWFNKKILISGSNTEKEIFTFIGTSSCNLRYPWNAPTQTNVGYTIYQDEYPVPMQSGRDIMVINPLLRYRLIKLDRYSAEDRTVFARFTFGIRPTHYSDGGTDQTSLVAVIGGSQLASDLVGSQVATSPTYNWSRLKVWPPVSTQQDLILLYHKTPFSLLNDTDQTVLPNEFEEVLIHLALYRIRQKIGSPGWMDDHQYAMRMLLQMREKQTTQSSYDYLVAFNAYPFFDPYATDSSLGVWPGSIR